MAISGVSPSTPAYASSTASLPPIGSQKHSHRSMSDIDAQGSSVTSGPSATGRPGSLLNTTA